MPEIAALLPAAPGPQTPPGGLSGLPVAPLVVDGSSPNFLGQLTAALKGLAAVASPLTPAAGRAQTPALAAPNGDHEPPPVASDPPPGVSNSNAGDLPALLAMLGLVPLPPALQPQAVPPPTAASGAVEPAPSAAASQAPGPELAPRRRQIVTSADTAPASELAPGAAADPATSPDTTSASSQVAPQAASPAATGPEPHPRRAVAPDTTSATPAAPPASAPPVTAPPASAPPVTAPPAGAEPSPLVRRIDTSQAVSAAPVGLTQRLPQQGSAPQSDDAGDGQRQHSGSPIGAVDSDSTDSTVSTANDNPAFNVAMAQAGAPTGAPSPALAAHPAGVVSQIAHQAELYRLPGNRGVRIQLHPDDLGGVQVTLRYAAGGSLELHINAEHAATGALVQQGWTELRDALATQGISPDRLVMSVTSPDSAGQLDFSSSGGGSGSYRPDPGPAQFGQGGQSERQRQQEAETGFSSRMWTGRVESSAAEDTVAASGAASRIDYRA